MALSRVLLAWESVLRGGAVAPRRLPSQREWLRNASQKSLRPMAWVSWAKSRVTTWLQAEKVRACLSMPYFLARLAVRWEGISLQSWVSMGNFASAGL